MDWNGDSLKDLLVGEYNGNIRYYQNVGTVGNPSLHYVGLLQAGGITLDVGDYSTVWTNDWNEDGLTDVIAGASDGLIRYYRNTGTATNPVLGSAQNLTLASGGAIDVGNRSCPNVADYNGDGIKDLISGDINGKVFYYQNNGTNANPLLANGVTLYTGNLELKTMSTSRLATVDWDNDNDMDIVIGSWDPRLKRYMRVPSSVPAPTCDLANTGGTVIPASGGTLNYNFTGNNSTGSTVNFDAWTNVSMPSYGPFSNPLLQRTGMSLAPGAAETRSVAQNVPGSAPSGSYYHYGYLGNLSQMQVYSWDYFYFSKQAGDCEPIIHDWACAGWECAPSATEPVPLPQKATLQASPNPFNPTTHLEFALPEAALVQMEVFNAVGQKVATLVNGYRDVGTHQLTWEAKGLPSGIYFAQLRVNDQISIQKVLLTK